MSSFRPFTRLPIVAALNLGSGLRAFCILTLGAGILCTAALAASGPGSKPATGANGTAAVEPSQFVGQDTCASCHEAVVKGFEGNPHTKMSLMHGNTTGVTCENC